MASTIIKIEYKGTEDQVKNDVDKMWGWIEDEYKNSYVTIEDVSYKKVNSSIYIVLEALTESEDNEWDNLLYNLKSDFQKLTDNVIRK